MKLVYTHPSHILVSQARSSLELAGIDCTLRNEYALGAMGELAPIDAWPELWVVKDRDEELAKQLIEQLQVKIKEPDWQCGKCNSTSPASFDWCWQCGGERSEDQSAQ